MFAIVGDRIQLSVLEVVIKGKDMLKDDLVRIILFVLVTCNSKYMETKNKNEEGEKKITKKNYDKKKKSSLSQRSKTPSFVRSHVFLKTYLPFPLVLGEYHIGVYLPG